MVEERPDFGLVTFEDGIPSPTRPTSGADQSRDGRVPRTSESGSATRDNRARSETNVVPCSSPVPIGLGHVQRDLAIVRELRREVPDLEIDWLAQQPVTARAGAGRRAHPPDESPARQRVGALGEARRTSTISTAFRRSASMDEILLANFMVFLEAVRETPYDLWIGDEAWEVDHYLHENPELKSAPYVFMTDFVGWVPIDRSAGSREAALTADYNAQMIEQVERFPYIRDRSLYFGDYEDLLPETFRARASRRYPIGPASTSRPSATSRRSILQIMSTKAHVRQRLGYDPDQPLVI